MKRRFDIDQAAESDVQPVDVRPGVGRRDLLRAGAALAVAGMAAPVLAGCSGGTAQSSGGKGTLTLLSWEGYRGKGISDSWLQSQDLRIVENLLASNEEVLTRLKAGGVGTIDLASPNVAYVPQLVAAGVLQPIDEDRIPNLKNLIDAIDETARQTTMVDGKLYAIPYVWGYDGMVYNSTKIKTPPTSWLDVKKPEYKGKILMISGSYQNFAIWPRLLGFESAKLTKDQLNQTVDFLIDLKKTQVRMMTADQTDMADLLSRGDAWIIGSACWVGVPKLSSGGDKLAFVMPKEGGGSTWIDSWVIPKNAPNLDGVYNYVNEMLSPQMQSKVAEGMGMATTVQNAVELMSAENREQYGYDGNQIGSTEAPLYRFPPEGGNYSTPQDWIAAWDRVAAA